MGKTQAIEQHAAEPTLNLALDTLAKKKQAFVFVNTKRSAEKTAEEIAKKIKEETEHTIELSEQVLHALPKPTQQCERLAKCVRKGIAFHHAGLHSKQKELIEDHFRKGVIKIICCTPTLCIVGNTTVLTEHMPVEARKLASGAKVVSLRGSKQQHAQVQAIVNQGVPQQLIEIETVGGKKIRLTGNHRVLLKKERKHMFVPALQCGKGDDIATLGKLKVKPKRVKLKALVKDNKLPLVNRCLTPEDCYVIGAMLGDGYSGAERAGDRIKYKGSPCIVGKEEVLKKVEGWCKIYGIHTRMMQNASGVPQLIISKANWLREFFLRCGCDKGTRKHITQELIFLPDAHIAALLRGLFDTDGYVEKRGAVGISSISKKLIENVQMGLLRFGIVGRVRQRPPGHVKTAQKTYLTKQSYEFLIAFNENVQKYSLFIGFSISRKQEMLAAICNRFSSNILYAECSNCKKQIYGNTFEGRTLRQKEWAKQKKHVIEVLAKKGTLSSQELTKLLGFCPRAKENRLNHHYALIQKQRKDNRDWNWSLNKLGMLIWTQALSKGISLSQFLKQTEKCLLCGQKLQKIMRQNWKKDAFEGDIYWDTIRNVSRVKNTEPVFDVVLNADRKREPVFVANGIFVHNSAGVDLPAFRAIIRDVKRFSGHGMNYIPVLEFLQMCGRAGRPSFDPYGEAIVVASSDGEKDSLFEKYVHGEPEEIYSKLAVEPVLRTYVLSLIASRVVQSHDQVLEFFSKTFWAHQFKDMKKLNAIIKKMLSLLEEWEFIQCTDDSYRATVLGKRIAELYIDPLTAYQFVLGLTRAKNVKLNALSWLQLIGSTLEMRPHLKVRTREYDEIQEKLAFYDSSLLLKEPSMFEPEFEEYLHGFKTALVLHEWIDEKDEEYLLEHHDIRPGETRAKLTTGDWLLYALSEIARIRQQMDLLKEIQKMRFRLRYGVKEELLTLLRLEGVGRVRARTLFRAGIKDLGDVRKAQLGRLENLLGKKIAASIKKQVGEEIPESSELPVPASNQFAQWENNSE